MPRYPGDWATRTPEQRLEFKQQELGEAIKEQGRAEDPGYYQQMAGEIANIQSEIR